MVKINFGELMDRVRRNEAFVVGEHSLTDLVIRPANEDAVLHYFYDKRRRTLIKRFVLGTTERTETYCKVTLIKRDEKYEPRLDVRIDNTSKAARNRAEKRLEDGEDGHLVKASVNLGSVHGEFWKLVDFLRSLPDVDLPRAGLAVVGEDIATEFKELLGAQDREQQLTTLKSVLAADLSEREVQVLVDRRAALDEYERLLSDDDYRAQKLAANSGNGEEAMWQAFFEEHPWIFGYGLKLIACTGFDEERLEQPVTGPSTFGGTGDRIDALMATQGQIRSLMFVEMKRPDTDLLATRPIAGDHDEYRSGVYRPSNELSGAVSQVEVTTHRAVKHLRDVHLAEDEDGYLAETIATMRPRQVVIAGTLSEFQRDDDGATHPAKFRSFELYRRAIKDVEIVTFDELLARARFIVAHGER